MNRWKRLLTVGMVLVVVLMAGAVLVALASPPAETAATTATEINWQVVASGGTTMTSSNFTLLSTTGQPVAGPAGSENYNLLSGYWANFQEVIRGVLLPFIVGN